MNKKMSDYPPTHLKVLQDRANENAKRVRTAWGNPKLSKKDIDTLKLVSLILVVLSPQ